MTVRIKGSTGFSKLSSARGFRRVWRVLAGLLAGELYRALLLCQVPAVPENRVSLTDAVQAVLARHPLIRYQQAQTDLDLGLKQRASSAFDTSLQANVSQGLAYTPLTLATQEADALIGVTGAVESTDLTQFSFSTTRLFRSGVSLAPSLTFSRSVDNLVNPQGLNIAEPNLQVNVPLLRGRGRSVVTAPEHAAQIEVEASGFDLTQQVSQLVSSAAMDYWNLRAAQDLLVIAREAEDRARTDVENTQTLVDADQLPRSNLSEVNASLFEAASTRIGAEQSVAAARYQLALDIALDPKEVLAGALTAADEFPQPIRDTDVTLTPARLGGCVDLALKGRSDYLAGMKRISEQQVQVAGAKNRLLPQLNVIANGGFQGLQEGRRFKDIFTSNVGGPTVSGGLVYNFAPKNDEARGLLLQATAAETEFEMQLRQLGHAITANVIIASAGVLNSEQQEKRTHAAVLLYRQSLEGQRQKYNLGAASVIDLLTTEDRLTVAQMREVEAELAYALALLQFRFQTGTVLMPGAAVRSLDANVFKSLPAGNCLD